MPSPFPIPPTSMQGFNAAESERQLRFCNINVHSRRSKFKSACRFPSGFQSVILNEGTWKVLFGGWSPFQSPGNFRLIAGSHLFWGICRDFPTNVRSADGRDRHHDPSSKTRPGIPWASNCNKILCSYVLISLRVLKRSSPIFVIGSLGSGLRSSMGQVHILYRFRLRCA